MLHHQAICIEYIKIGLLVLQAQAYEDMLPKIARIYLLRVCGITITLRQTIIRTFYI